MLHRITSRTGSKWISVLSQQQHQHSFISARRGADTAPGGISSRFQSSLSSFAEPEQTLFDTNRLNKLNQAAVGTVMDDDDLDKQLRADVKTMGSMLGTTIRHYEGDDILETIESLRLSAKVCISRLFGILYVYL